MNQNQCVPSWDLEDVGPTSHQPPPPPSRMISSRSHSTSHSAGPDISMLDYEVAELTWENGQLTMHGLGLPRVPSKSNLSTWPEKVTPTRASGTLESIVNQATKKPHPLLTSRGTCDHDNDLVPWLNPNGSHHYRRTSAPASLSMTMDALVPTAANRNNGPHNREQQGGGVGCSTRVGSCSAVGRVPVGSEWSVSASESTRNERVKYTPGETSEQVEIGGGGMTSNNGVTSTSFGTSPENTKTITVDDHDSVCHSTPQKERDAEEGKQKRGATKSSLSITKRSRAAAIHNQSERKRRDKINQRMKTLQKLVPNSNKTDKASMLDEVIDYLKQLQAQVQMMSRMSMPSMMMPMAIQQQLQMSMMSQMGMAGMGMGMGMAGMPGMGMHGMDHMNMNINSMQRPTIPGISPGIMNPAAFMPLAVSWDGTSVPGGDRLPSHQQAMVPADLMSSYLACQSQPTTMDAYNRIAAMYQQHAPTTTTGP